MPHLAWVAASRRQWAVHGSRVAPERCDRGTLPGVPQVRRLVALWQLLGHLLLQGRHLGCHELVVLLLRLLLLRLLMLLLYVGRVDPWHGPLHSATRVSFSVRH